MLPMHRDDLYITAWHGLNPELWMTIGVIVFGILCITSKKVDQCLPLLSTMVNVE